VTWLPLSRAKVKVQLVAAVLNSQHARTGATKILSTCRGRRHIVAFAIWCSFNCEMLRVSTVFLVVQRLFVRLSVHPSVTWVEVIVEFLFNPIAPSFAFLISSAGTQFEENPFLFSARLPHHSHFFDLQPRYPIVRNPFFGKGGKNTRTMGKFCDFRLKSLRVAVAD